MPTRPNDQAFPLPSVYAAEAGAYEAERGNAGLTIREEFAKAIMAGFAGAPDCLRPDDGCSDVYLGTLARGAVRWADALIAALNEKKE